MIPQFPASLVCLQKLFSGPLGLLSQTVWEWAQGSVFLFSPTCQVTQVTDQSLAQTIYQYWGSATNKHVVHLHTPYDFLKGSFKPLN